MSLKNRFVQVLDVMDEMVSEDEIKAYHDFISSSQDNQPSYHLSSPVERSKEIKLYLISSSYFGLDGF